MSPHSDKDMSTQPYDESKHRRDAGGRFATKPASEVDLVLDAYDRAQEIDEAATSGDYVAPSGASTELTGRSREVDGWRDAAALTGEYNHAEGAYPKFTDQARRTTYRGPLGELKMPNKKAIVERAQATAGTFDVPVSMNGTVSWVRLTPGQRGVWEVEPVAGHTPDQVATSEAVCAVLEARRPTTALTAHDATSLMRRRRERLEARGARQHDITSSWIRSTGYQPAGRMMVMRTKDTWTKGGEHRPGRVYGFRDVPAEHYTAMAKADRPGAVFNDLIKGQHQRVAVDQCGSCGAYYSTDAQAGHSCTSGVGTTPRSGAGDSRYVTQQASQRLRRVLAQG